MRLEPVIAGLLFTLVSTAATNPAAVTFTKDVAPVLQKNCQNATVLVIGAVSCSLTSRPGRRKPEEAVLLKKMPPWLPTGTMANFQ
jgi:hypothetical protein